MTIRTEQFQFNGATITCRESLGMDAVDDIVIYSKLDYNRQNERERNRAQNFADAVMRTVSVEGDLGYPWVTVDSPAADMQAAFDAWQQWPPALIRRWQSTLYVLNQAVGDIELQPGIEKNVSPPPSNSDAGA